MAAWDLTALVNAADAKAPLAERHLWLVRLLEWLRHARQTAASPSVPPSPSAPVPLAGDATAAAAEARTPLPVLRLRHLLNQIDKQPGLQQRVRGLAQAFWDEIDAPSLYADLGFGARVSFASELLSRLQDRVLPGTPQTRDLAALFRLLFKPADRHWVAAIDAPTLARTAALLSPGPAALQATLLEAVTILVSAVQAAGYTPSLRQRMERALLQGEPFRQLTGATALLRDAVVDGRHDDALRHSAYLRALLDSCRRAAGSVLPHLEQYGVSVNIVFNLEQLQGRTLRIEQLLDCVLARDPVAEGHRLLLELLGVLAEQQGVRAVAARHYSLLARQVAERSAETGEHYITSTRGEYRDMLRRAAGGGIVIAGTVFIKFGLAALGMSAFWSGFWAGGNYALSFLIVMLMHWTVATKQPAMTAPALAATLPLGGTMTDGEIESFVDRIVQLIRSQAAGIFGNLALCAPLVLLVQWLAWISLDKPLVGVATAHHTVEVLMRFGPTLVFAAFTGTLLFASSLIAGWAENWFVFHRLDSAIAWNPRIVGALGAGRAQRWARWWRANVSGVAANVSLGMMLGLVPALLSFLAVPLDVRHVTLASGQLGAALGALGPGLLKQHEFWWCVAGIAATGMLNLSVSFWLAFKVALRSRGVRVKERRRIAQAVRRRVRQQPLSFLRPPREWR